VKSLTPEASGACGALGPRDKPEDDKLSARSVEESIGAEQDMKGHVVQIID